MRVVNNGYRMREIAMIHTPHFVDSLRNWLCGRTVQHEEGTLDTLVFVWDYMEFINEYLNRVMVDRD